MSRCSMCGGTGRTEQTALDRLDLAETGVMDLQCLACDGTGQTMLTPPPGLWCPLSKKNTARIRLMTRSNLETFFSMMLCISA